MDDAWGTAEVAKDTAALGRILDDRFVFNDTDGTTSGKADLLAKVAAWRLTGETLSERTMVLVGTTAVVFGTTELRFATKAGGENKLRFRYTATYVKSGGDWRALAIQMDKRDPSP